MHDIAITSQLMAGKVAPHCASGTNIAIEHGVAGNLESLAFNGGTSTTAAVLTVMDSLIVSTLTITVFKLLLPRLLCLLPLQVQQQGELQLLTMAQQHILVL